MIMLYEYIFIRRSTSSLTSFFYIYIVFFCVLFYYDKQYRERGFRLGDRASPLGGTSMVFLQPLTGEVSCSNKCINLLFD